MGRVRVGKLLAHRILPYLHDRRLDIAIEFFPQHKILGFQNPQRVRRV